MIRKKFTRDNSTLFWMGILVLSMVSAITIRYSIEIKTSQLLKIFVIIFLVLGCMEWIANNHSLTWFQNWSSIRSIWIGYAITLTAISVYSKIFLYVFFIFGSVFIARKVHPYIGIVFHLIFSFLLYSIYDFNIEKGMYYFLAGGILCILIGSMDTLVSMVYILIIAVCMQIILGFLMNNFIFDRALSLSMAYQITGDCMAIILCYFLKGKQNVPYETEIPNFQNIEPKETLLSPEEPPGYGSYITVDAPLLKRLNEEKSSIYRHSLLVGILSEKAIRKIGGNYELAKAGGLYHEIGKLEEGNYIETGVALAKEQGIPEPIVSIIKQHNGKMEKPKSKEAATIMFTDSIVSTIKYFEKQDKEKQLSNKQIIENVFKVRLEKGILDESGLTLVDFKQLKDFYLHNLPKGEKE
ncbi:MAG: HDIG domain-containing protein [Acetivibrio sp.]